MSRAGFAGSWACAAVTATISMPRRRRNILATESQNAAAIDVAATGFLHGRGPRVSVFVCQCASEWFRGRVAREWKAIARMIPRIALFAMLLRLPNHHAEPVMKYRKNEAKEYAKKMLHGVWTALPTIFTRDDRVDEAGNAANLEHCISKLNLAGHYCLGNVGEFWAMTNEERMRVDGHQRRDGEGPRAAHRRLPPPEPVRGGQAGAARAVDRHRFRDHPHALHGGAQRRRRVRIFQAGVRARGHRRRALQHRADLPDLDEAREAPRRAAEHLRLQAGREQAPARPPRCATRSARRWK